MAQTRTAARWTDVAALGLSALCLVHCLLLPVLAALLPALGSLTGIHWLHPLLVALAAPVAALMIFDSSRTPGRRGIALQGAVGLALLVAALVVPALERHEQTVTLAGGLLLAGAHVRRWLRLRCRGGT